MITPIHTLFSELPVADTCSWYGTTYEGIGKEARLLPCGEPTVGVGLFCEPMHKLCQYHSVCERHKKPIEAWEAQPSTWE